MTDLSWGAPDLLHAQCAAFVEARRRGEPLAWDDGMAFLSALRQHASQAPFQRLFETQAGFNAREFKALVIGVEAELEKLMARRYIEGDASSLEPELGDGYSMADKEGRALGLDGGGDDLYFVGCGAAPLTAMRYRELFSTRIVCIDRDSEALALARRMLTVRFGAAEVAAGFRFVHASAEALQWPAGSVTRLLLAAHLGSKEALLHRLAPALAPGGRVLVRLPMGLYEHVYDEVALGAAPEYEVIAQVSDAAEPFCRAAALARTPDCRCEIAPSLLCVNDHQGLRAKAADRCCGSTARTLPAR